MSASAGQVPASPKAESEMAQQQFLGCEDAFYEVNTLLDKHLATGI